MSAVPARPLLEVRDLGKTFETTRRDASGGRETLRALDGVSFSVGRGRTTGIVGESGSGKSTAARALLRLIEPTQGSVTFDGIDLLALAPEPLRRFRRRMQMVFQDTTGTLDPRMSVGALIEEPLGVHRIGSRAERRAKAASMLERVGFDPAVARRRPHEFSGGQRQRIGIARALALAPELLVLDEPVSAIDLSVQAQILNLLKDLQAEFAVSYVFIVHDLHVAEFFCDEIVVLYLGEVMEAGPSAALFGAPQHPYTASLVSAVPTVRRGAAPARRIILEGEIAPISGERPKGCIFRPRCPIGRDRALCADVRPPLAVKEAGHSTACHFPGELAL